VIQLKRILFPSDISVSSARPREYALALCEQFGADLHLLHVIHDWAGNVPEFGMGLALPAFAEQAPERRRAAEEHAIAQLAALVPGGWQDRHKVTIAVKEGQPFVEIVRYAQEHEIDLIVIGTHGRGAIAHALMGSVAERVVRQAPCPVLTVRPESHHFVMP
jgi:nucleotide-binding universal stress UspA family protein